MTEKIRKCCYTCEFCEDDTCLAPWKSLKGGSVEVHCGHPLMDHSDCPHYCPCFESIDELKEAWGDQASRFIVKEE